MLNTNFLSTNRKNCLAHLHIRKLKVISKRHKLALRQSSSKFYSQHKNSSDSGTSNSFSLHANSRFSSVLFSKNTRMLIADSKNIENLDKVCNSFVQIELACKKISDQYIDGTFYLYNNYPSINVSMQSRHVSLNINHINNLGKLNASKLSKLIKPARNICSSRNICKTSATKASSQQKIFSKENELMLKYFS